MKKLFLVAAALLLAGLLSGCKEEEIDPSVWECPISGLEWGMTAEEANKVCEMTACQSGDNYVGYSVGNMTFFDTEGELTLWFDDDTGLTTLKFTFTEEKPGTLKKAVSARYGTSKTDEEGESTSYGGYWTSDYASTLYTDDEIYYAYRMYYKIALDDDDAQELKTFANGNQPLYYVRVLENDDGEGTMSISATMARVLDVYMLD